MESAGGRAPISRRNAVGALAIDRLGLFKMPARLATPGRLGGLSMILGGLVAFLRA